MGSSSSAPNWTVLLVSCCKDLIRSIRSAIKAVKLLRLEVCKKTVEASSRTQRKEVLLVLLDVTQATENDELQRCLEHLTSNDVAFATVSWGDAFEETVVSTFLGNGASDHLELPHDLGKLDDLI